QGELSALERGTHALHSGMDVKAYAEAVGRANTSVHREVCAARVAATVPHMGNDLIERTRQLAEIHAAPSWLWPALAAELVTRGWTVDATGRCPAVREIALRVTTSGKFHQPSQALAK
ncbi:MAG: hypothetical protein U1E17_12000, partial [Geminicoccaceae bacterium]